MFKSVKSTIVFLILFAGSLYSIWAGGHALFIGNIVGYSKFKEFVLSKKIQKVYIANNKAWFFKSFGRGRAAVTKQWETFVGNEKESMTEDLLNFLKENNIQAITNPTFINTYWVKIVGLLWLLMGSFLMGKLLTKPDFM